MIIGKGLIAKQFQNHDNDDVVYFALEFLIHQKQIKINFFAKKIW